MKLTLSYSGGTARGRQLAREFDRMGYLSRLYLPSYSHKVNYLPSVLTNRLDIAQGMDFRKVRTSAGVRFVRSLMRRTARVRKAKPTERYLVCDVTDRLVARQLKADADLVMVEAQIALHTIRRAKELGMTTILDRTNSHIMYQSEIWEEENAKMGIEWVPNSERVIEKGIREYEEADYIFALSSYVRRTFLERGVPAEKVICVPSGVDLTPFRQVKKDDDVFRIVYCGILQPKKGTHYLLEAFSELNLKNAELCLIGSVSEEIAPFMRQYEGSYKHFGFINNTELYKYYSQGSVFVIPSLEEGLAKVIIEAMACGLPVIGSVNTGAEDVVRNGLDGFVVPIRDKEVLKEKILFMYENRDKCSAMGESAKARVHDEYTLDRYVERLLGAYSAILA
jgi:glycosyltransferase involved in cell wall biosynthesis